MLLQRLQWRRVFLAGVVVAALFTIFAFLTQSVFWFVVGGGVLMLTGMTLFVMGSLQSQQPPQKKGKKGPKGKRR